MEDSGKENRILTVLITAVVTLAVVAGAVFVGYKFFGLRLIAGDEYDKVSEFYTTYDKLERVAREVDEKGLYEVDKQKQLDELCKSIAESVGDKYTEYMTAEEAEEWKSLMHGVFFGIGVGIIERDDGTVLVQTVTPKSPALAAGLKTGDVITKVDGKEYHNIEDFRNAIVGEKDTPVEITYIRDGEEHTVKITRGEVNEISVYSGETKDNIGYIRIASFHSDTAEAFKTELSALEKKGLDGVIIDLRGNGGGFMDQALEVADMLLPEGTITYTETRDGTRQYYNSGESATDMKYVLLVDRYSASASEIVTAAIKDNKGGSIVGETTYGKGVIQEELTYPDGSLLRLTIQEYFSPNDSRINGVGIKPDYEVAIGAEEGRDMQFEKAIELLKQK